jgi:hypothetical protein
MKTGESEEEVVPFGCVASTCAWDIKKRPRAPWFFVPQTKPRPTPSLFFDKS